MTVVGELGVFGGCGFVIVGELPGCPGVTGLHNTT